MTHEHACARTRRAGHESTPHPFPPPVFIFHTPSTHAGACTRRAGRRAGACKAALAHRPAAARRRGAAGVGCRCGLGRLLTPCECLVLGASGLMLSG
eukprot:129475-Chlamydomonas_euryale.AAC.2